tara:strand:+ start:3636 stop:4025 length:390 start_codon:yes stop_codon:yes gene_type:complete
MSAGKYNFIVEQGSQHEVTFRYKLADGTYQSLTGYHVRMSVKDHITDETFVYQATSDQSQTGQSGFAADFVISDQSATPGQFVLTIPSGTTRNFNFNQGVYDLEIAVNSSGLTTRLLEGKFKVKPEVSS